MISCLLQNKKFHCREWAFSKILHCLENRSNAKTCGVLIVGGPGCGKTALCCELVWPTNKTPKNQYLNRRLLAYHFCQAHNIDTLQIKNFITSIATQIFNWSYVDQAETKKLFSNDQVSDLCIKLAESKNPSEAFATYLLEPLNEIEPPANKTLFILVDSIDEASILQPKCETASTPIAELLGKYHHLFPPWMLLVCTARKQNKLITHLFTGFKKISLDDLKKPHVVKDVQQYILNRLDKEEKLKAHLSNESPETLNQLHIKCNGCFAYLENVLNYVSENIFTLNEVREIPGTLNGLYLWLCQKLFPKNEFDKIKPILNLILATKRPLSELEIFECLLTRKDDDYIEMLNLLRNFIVSDQNGCKIFFHYSFAEWLIDVKHCTNRYLCNVGDGHAMFVLHMVSQPSNLKGGKIAELTDHLLKASKTSEYFSSFNKQQLVYWLLNCPIDFENSFVDGLFEDYEVNDILVCCGAKIKDENMQLEIQKQKEIYASQNKLQQNEQKEISKCKQMKQLQSHNNNNDDNNTNISDPKTSNNINNLDNSITSSIIEHAKNDQTQQTEDHVSSIIINNNNNNNECPSPGREKNLACAVKLGDAELVKNILQSDMVNINEVDCDGWTLLRSAAWGGHNEIVDLLLEAGVDVDQCDKDGRTALRAAAWGGHEDIVLKLLAHGADVNKADKEGRTALIAAAYMGHATIVEHLVGYGAHVNHEDVDGRTALSVASLCSPGNEGRLKVVSRLLESGADPNHQDKEGMTPLLVASFEGHDLICELLLENDADIDHSDNAGRTALQAAVSMGHYKTVSLLLFWGAAIDTIDNDGRTVLCTACHHGNIDIVRLLLNRGLDETHRDNNGWTPLHIAAFEGHKKTVEALLEAGARLLETDNDGRVALILGAQGGHVDVVSVLLNRGTPIESHGHDGRTSLRCACLAGKKDVVSLLLSRGSNVNSQDADGRSILHAIALNCPTNKICKNHSYSESLKMVPYLLERGADPNLKDLEDRTPLHLAALQGNQSFCELLLNKEKLQIDVDSLDFEGRTALHMASFRGHLLLVELFLKHNVDVNKQCLRGETALWLASREGHSGVVEKLLVYGCDPEICDIQGRNAYRIASKYNHQKVLKILRNSLKNNNQLLFGNNINNKDDAIYSRVERKVMTPMSATSELGSSLERKHYESNGLNNKITTAELSTANLVQLKTGRSPTAPQKIFPSAQSSSSSGCESGLSKLAQQQQYFQQQQQLKRRPDSSRHHSRSIDYSSSSSHSYNLPPPPPSASSSSLLINSLLSPVQEPAKKQMSSASSSSPLAHRYSSSSVVNNYDPLNSSSPMSEVIKSCKASPCDVTNDDNDPHHHNNNNNNINNNNSRLLSKMNKSAGSGKKGLTNRSFQQDEMIIENIWQRQQNPSSATYPQFPSVKVHSGDNINNNINNNNTNNSSIVANCPSVDLMSSPEFYRKKRNGIVTNPCFSSASSSVTLDSTSHSPSISAARSASRPKGLLLKRETPL